ncbi:MAG: efflux transporter periplasmic adaptor subunit [Gammaproteobacteria bacterium]|nr:MAG: efflux transporter periplasmic adaptor subunit [Gammaproteobacteria bacterium]
MDTPDQKEIVMTPRRLLPGLVLAAVLLASCQQGSDEVVAETEEDESPAIPVETALPTRGDIYAVYSGTAPIEAFADATVIAKVGGEIREVLAEEGDDVRSGQVLARLDGDRLRLEKEQAEANLRKLQRDYQRNVDLKGKGLVSEGDFEKIRYEMEALQATFDLAELELGYTEIRAPIDGVVSERFIKVGNTIDVNEQAFKVTSLEPLISYLHVPEREYRRIEPGQKVIIDVDALSGASFEAVVARISPIVDPETGTFKISIEVSDASRRLKPGMFGRIGIVFDMHANALQIPRSAIVESAGQSSVFIVSEDIVERRLISTGYAESGQIEVLQGLDDMDEIVVVGQTSLKDGSKISVINAPATTTSTADNESLPE